MGQLKDEALKNNNEDIQQHQLTPAESNYLRLLNLSLQYHTLGQKIMSGFLYYICTQRLGYQEGVNLQFEFDFDAPDNKLTVRLLPANLSELPATPTPNDAPPAAPTGEAPTASAETPAPSNQAEGKTPEA